MLNRLQLETSIKKALARSRGVVLSGPRQSGKTTLAQKFLSHQSPNYFDLEYPPHAQRLEQATHQGAELDLLLFKGSQRIGVEFKRADAPRMTPSMRIAIDNLKLDALYVVYPGLHRCSLMPGVEVVPLWALLPGSVALN